MGSRFLCGVCGVLCVLISIHVSDAAGENFGSSALLPMGSGFDRQPLASGQSCGQGDLLASPSVSVGWMTAPQHIKVGYDGLVLPGSCVSSYFSYPLDGLQIGASLPIRLSCQHELRLYGSALIPHNWQAGQEITWTDFQPGIREWRHSRTQLYRLGAEALYRTCWGMALVGGFRWESLLSNFSDPNPAYRFTIAAMEAQTTVTIYEPYVGIRLESVSGPGGLKVQAVGLPFLLASIQHLNVCNNGGIPFAHTGSQSATKGYFFEASVEYGAGITEGMGVAAFADWTVYRGECPMTIERHEAGATPPFTSATVGWSHNINAVAVGGKVALSWNLPL